MTMLKKVLNTKAQAFTSTNRWQRFMEHLLSNSEISQLMTPFLYTEWYMKENLIHSLGRLRIQLSIIYIHVIVIKL